MSYPIAHAPPFQARWDATNFHLKDSVLTQVVWKVFAITLLLISYFYFPKLFPVLGLAYLNNGGMNGLARGAILPTAAVYNPHGPSRQDLQKIEKLIQRKFLGMQQPFSLEKYIIETPDGILLATYLIKPSGNPLPPTRTLVHFNPSVTVGLKFAHTQLNLMQKISDCQFIFFDYRGSGNSEGSFMQSKDLIVDGSSIVQWIHNHLNIPKHQIHFYGRGLGGAVAAETQALDPKLTGQHINEHSFSSLTNVVKSRMGFLGIGLSWFLKNQGYELDAEAAFTKIRGKKLLIYYGGDEIIPLEANLYGVQHRGEISFLWIESGDNFHNLRLPPPIIQQIAKFIPSHKALKYTQ